MSETTGDVERPTLKYKSDFDNLFNNETRTRFFEGKNLGFSEEQQVPALPLIGDAAKKRRLTSEQIAELSKKKFCKLDDIGRQFNEDRGIKMSFPKEKVDSMLFSIINEKPNDLFYEIRNNPEKYPMEYKLTEDVLKEVKMRKIGNTFKEAGKGALDAALILAPIPFGKTKAAASIGNVIKPIESSVTKFATKYAKPFITKTVSSFAKKYGAKAVETIGDALNPGKYVDAIASRFGASTAYNGFGANTVPGMFTNSLIGAELGYQGYEDLRYNKNKKLTNYIEDVSLLGLPVANIIPKISSIYKNMQNTYNLGKRVYNLHNYINSMPFSYTGVPGNKVKDFERVMRNEIPRTFNIWTSNNRYLGKYLYGRTGNIYKVRSLNHNKRMFNTPRVKDYNDKEVDAFYWSTLPYNVKHTTDGVTVTKSIYEPGYTELVRSKKPLKFIVGLPGSSSSTDNIFNTINQTEKYDGTIFNDMIDGSYFQPFSYLRRRLLPGCGIYITPITKVSAYNCNAPLLLSPNESAWKTAWDNRNNKDLINRMLLDKNHSLPVEFSPE